MTATTHQVTKTVVTRSWADVDPKVITAAALTAVCDVILVVLFLAGRIDATVLVAGVGPSSAAVLGAYVKRSTHIDPAAVAAEVQETLEAAEPILDQVAPAAVPAVQVAEDSVAAIQAQLQQPTPLA